MVNIIKDLSVLLPGQVLSGQQVSDRYSVDWSGESAFTPAIVVRAKTVSDVSKLLVFCHQRQLPIVTQGGMTGLSGGSTPRASEIVLSLELLSGITDVDVESMTLTALAGTPLEQLQQAANDVGFYLPLDLGARGSCTIGGNVATNAGGNQVLSYGMTRALVLGLEAVTADGTVIRSMNKMLKNNAGYDLKQLFIGSEGTLGVVTEVVLRLYPKPLTKQSALCGFSNFSQVVSFLQYMQRSCSRVSTFELMWDNYVKQVRQMNQQLTPVLADDHSFYVLIEIEGNDPARDDDCFNQQLQVCIDDGLLNDAVVAQSERDVNRFWQLRDGVIDILTKVKYRANFDIGVPISQMASFVHTVELELAASFKGLQLCTFGHMADGNLHIIAWTGREDDVDLIYERVYTLVGTVGGTITAEHGIGTMKRQYLSLCRSEQEIDLMRALKKAMDPNNILNPGRVI
jgi:FAD/FMN-containing dehydrogenase